MMGATSIRRRLTLLLLAGAAALSLILWFLVRDTVERAAQETQDGILGAATLAVADEIRSGVDGIEVDIPFLAFSILGAAGEDRIFHRVTLQGQTVTGYADLPLPDASDALAPAFLTTPFRGETVRVAVVERTLLDAGQPVQINVALAQGSRSKDALAARLNNRAALVGLGFFLLTAGLAVLTARSVTSPVRRLATSVARRGPDDLRPVDRPVPSELAPLVAALNGFMSRLEASATRTETFIAEAAHHIRTPLTALRTRAEIAQRGADAPTRDHLREILRLTDGTARTAGQLLDHAAVIHRSDQGTAETVDLSRLATDVVRATAPMAEMRDINLRLDAPEQVTVTGDRIPIEAALRNLIDNAIKYSPDESDVDIIVSETGLSVLDRGRGLTDPVDKLLRRFARGGNAGDVVGSGLGLAIVDDAARSLGGTLTLTLRDGGGTCATLSIPSARS